MISIYLLSRKVSAPVIEYYRVAADTKAFADDKALNAHLMSEADKANKGEDSDAVFVDSQVLPYEGKPEFKSAKAENAAIAQAAVEAQRRSIVQAKKIAVDMAKAAKDDKKASK